MGVGGRWKGGGKERGGRRREGGGGEEEGGGEEDGKRMGGGRGGRERGGERKGEATEYHCCAKRKCTQLATKANISCGVTHSGYQLTCLSYLSNSWNDWKEAMMPVRWQGTGWMLWNLLKFVRSSLKLYT